MDDSPLRMAERALDRPNIRVDAFGLTHRGMVREMNEDRYFLQNDHGVWAVADGMGGHQGGELASASVVENLSTVGQGTDPLDLRSRVVDRLERSNAEVFELARQRSATIGSTVVALAISGKTLACIWCGDSRLYRIRNRQIEQISLDHSEVQQLLSEGSITPKEAENWPRKNVITRAIGVAEDAGIDVVSDRVEDGDCFVLCSDGLTEHLSDVDILDHVEGSRSEMACEKLIATTLDRGARDNVTVVVVRCLSGESTIPVDWTS